MAKPSNFETPLGRGAREFLLCIERASTRSVSISFVDEGGFDGATSAEVDRLFQKLARQVDQLSDCRVLIRLAKFESYRVSIATTSTATGVPEILLRF